MAFRGNETESCALTPSLALSPLGADQLVQDRGMPDLSLLTEAVGQAKTGSQCG